TTVGGSYGQGVVFELTPDSNGGWTETILHEFTGGDDGGQPHSGVVFDDNGALYGTTSLGGTGAYCIFNCGTVFKLTHNSDGTWTQTVIYNFTGFTDGGAPYTGLVIDASGNMYGTTAYGGDHATCTRREFPQGCGTVFELSSTSDGWTESV